MLLLLFISQRYWDTFISYHGDTNNCTPYPLYKYSHLSVILNFKDHLTRSVELLALFTSLLVKCLTQRRLNYTLIFLALQAFFEIFLKKVFFKNLLQKFKHRIVPDQKLLIKSFVLFFCLKN